MLRYLPFVLSLALTVYCAIDCVQTEESRVRNLPKLAWLLLIVLFPLVGPVTWLVAGRPERNLVGGASQQERWEDHRRRRGGDRQPPRGPDDDPDFLRGL